MVKSKCVFVCKGCITAINGKIFDRIAVNGLYNLSLVVTPFEHLPMDVMTNENGF